MGCSTSRGDAEIRQVRAMAQVEMRRLSLRSEGSERAPSRRSFLIASGVRARLSCFVRSKQKEPGNMDQLTPCLLGVVLSVPNRVWQSSTRGGSLWPDVARLPAMEVLDEGPGEIHSSELSALIPVEELPSKVFPADRALSDASDKTTCSAPALPHADDRHPFRMGSASSPRRSPEFALRGLILLNIFSTLRNFAC